MPTAGPEAKSRLAVYLKSDACESILSLAVIDAGLAIDITKCNFNCILQAWLSDHYFE